MSDFKAKCTKFDFCWGSAPDLLAVFKRPTSKGREGEEKEWKRNGGKWKRRGVEGREGEGKEGEEPAPKYFGLEPPLFGCDLKTWFPAKRKA